MRLISQFLIAATLCLFGLGSTSQSAEHIKDSLGLFSEQAIKAANQRIDQVYQKHGWTIAIETRDAAETIPNLPREAKTQNDFLTSWTTKNYKDNKLQGIYLVIFKDPSKFRYHIDSDQEATMGVTRADKKTWDQLLEDNLRLRDFDAVLLTTVGSMSAKLSKSDAPAKGFATPPLPGDKVAGQNRPLGNQPDGRQAPEGNEPAAEGPSILMWVLIAVGVFIIYRIIRGVMSSMSNSNSGYGPGGTPNQYGPGNGTNMGGPNMGGPGYGQGGYGAPGRGGGMMSGMLGGLFGGMAGSWMYDKMSGGHQSHSDSSQGNYTSHNVSDDSARHDSYSDNSSSQESDSTTYGGDWGDSGGGGDFGGGGDSGGDAGGGGDW